MATRRQKAAARRNIKKAQAARKHMDNPAKKRRKSAAKRRTTTKRRKTAAKRRTTRVSRRRTIAVSLPKPRTRKLQRVATVVVKQRKRKSRAAAPAAPKRRRRKAARRSSPRRPRRPRVTAGVPQILMLKANPTKRPRSKRKAAARKAARTRRRSTQVLKARRNAKRIIIKRNPSGMMGGYESLLDNPGVSGFGFGQLFDNPGPGPMHSFYDDNPLGGLVTSMRDNPAYDENLVYDENPADMGGAFSAGNIKRFGVAAGGVALGLVVADFLDRYVATRKPKDDGEANKANQPWYGRDAAAAQRARPDAYRLGAQAVGAAGSIALAYQLRGKNWAPWVFGGLSLGFGSNLIKMIADWWLMPAIFKVPVDNDGNADFSKASFASRMYPLEQKVVQDKVADLFKKWGGVADLAAAQAKENPAIQSPLSADTATSVYTLGQPAQQSLFGQPRVLAATRSTVGATACPNCGGVGGCFSGCPTSCPGDCPQGVTPGHTDSKPLCQYTLKAGDDLVLMASSVGIDVADIVKLNNKMSPAELVVGMDIVLPYELCAAIELGNAGRVLPSLPSLPASRITPPNTAIPVPLPGERGGPPGPPSPELVNASVIKPMSTITAAAVPVIQAAAQGRVQGPASNAARVANFFNAVSGTPNAGTVGAPTTEADREIALRSFGADMRDE